MHDEREVETMKRLLVEYIELMAERHDYGASEGFEYQLWDDLEADLMSPTLVTREEAKEIVYLAVHSHSWVTFDLETGTLQIIDLEAWRELLQKRGH